MGTGLVRLRIRGIYATALTKLFLDSGFQVVQASKIIADRFNIPQVPAPADVTVKDTGDGSELLIIGYPDHARKVLDTLRKRLPYSLYWSSKLPLHATVKAVVAGPRNGKCIAKVGEVEAEVELPVDQCSEGQQLVASVVRPAVKPVETPRLRPGARVIGDYAIVFDCDTKTTTFSEHIRSAAKRAELLALASSLLADRTCIHWRSSAQHADQNELKHHVEELLKRLEKLRAEMDRAEPGTIVGGELVAIASLSSIDKEELDRLRREVVPTTPLHHSLKSLDPNLQDIVDLLDTLTRYIDPATLSRAVKEYIASKVTGKRITIHHVRLDGSTIRLGEAYVETALVENDALVLTLKRSVRSPGVYDGLEIRKEPGDTIETVVDTSKWTIIHRYYSQTGELKGVYVNINTPPEIVPSRIRYLDLSVDVIKRPGEPPRIIDLEEFAEAVKNGTITARAACRALEAVVEEAGEERLREAIEELKDPAPLKQLTDTQCTHT